MLKACAPEAEIREKLHHYWVIYKKGAHGAGDRAEIQIGKVRHMIRDLGIDEDCALARLGLPTKPKNTATHS